MILLFSSILNTALAVPIQVNQQGRLLDADGEGLTGSHQLIFQLYDEQTGGDIQWGESITVQFNNGYYSTMLGTDEETNPLDNSIFANYPLYLELKVNGEALSPRHQLTSVPYAQIAGVAESVDGGTVSASEVIVGGQTVIDSDGNWVGEGMVDTLNSLSCALGEIAGWNGSAWTCVSDNTLTYTDIENYLLNNPIELNVDTTIGGSTVVSNADDSDTLAELSCVNDGEIARYDLVLDEWYCDADIDTVLDEATVETYITNGAIDLNSNTTVGGNTVVTSATTLNPNWLDINNRPSGLDDGDNDALANTVCTDGQILVYDIATNAWICGTDTDTTLSPTEVQGMIESMSSLELQGSTMIGGEIPLLASNHGNDADAHHSHTSDGLDITPASVTIQNSTTSLTEGSLNLGSGADDVLTTAMVQTLTGGGDADSLHTHTATNSLSLCDPLSNGYERVSFGNCSVNTIYTVPSDKTLLIKDFFIGSSGVYLKFDGTTSTVSAFYNNFQMSLKAGVPVAPNTVITCSGSSQAMFSGILIPT